MQAQELVRVKVLKNVGRFQADEIVEIPAEEARFLCSPRTVQLGEGKTQSVAYAMKLDDWEDLQKLPTDVNELYSDEMQKLGIKNIVETPKDPAFEARMSRLTQTEDLPAEPEELTDSVRDLKAKGKKVTKKAE
jgi:hypothetical protein